MHVHEGRTPPAAWRRGRGGGGGGGRGVYLGMVKENGAGKEEGIWELGSGNRVLLTRPWDPLHVEFDKGAQLTSGRLTTVGMICRRYDAEKKIISGTGALYGLLAVWGLMLPLTAGTRPVIGGEVLQFSPSRPHHLMSI